MELFELAIKFHFFRGRKTMDEEKDPQPTSPVAEEAQPAKKAKKPLSKKKKILIGVIVALFVIGAVGGNGNGAGNTAASSDSQQSASTTVEKKEKKKTPAKVKVDKSELESYIDSYGSVAADGYTEDSYQAYLSALENAKSVDADEDATQSQVDSAKGSLYTAYNGLVEAFNPANYSWPAYRDVARNPDSYSGQKLAFKGKVLQVVEGDSETDLRIATDGGYDDVIFVGFDPSIMGGTRVLEDDTVTIYGTCVGQYSYQSTMGAKISLPGLYADQVEINQ